MDILFSKMAANVATKTQKYAYLSSQLSYSNKWSVKLHSLNVGKSISLTGNKVGMFLSKVATNMAAKAQNMCISAHKLQLQMKRWI